MRQHFVEAEAVVGEHAGPAQQLIDRQRRRLRKARTHAGLSLGNLVGKRGVQRQTARRALAGLQIQATFDLAAPQLGADAFANRRFSLAQVVDDAKAKVEVA